MTEMKAERVTATNRSNGHVFHGVREVASGVVYPFMSTELCDSVVADVNDGKERLSSYGAMFAQELYDIEAVQS